MYTEAKARPLGLTGRGWDLCTQTPACRPGVTKTQNLSKSRMPTKPQTTAQIPPAVRESAVARHPQMDSSQHGVVKT